jgi:hypothetical protein
MSQTNLGLALMALGKREDGAVGEAHLAEAADALLAALEVRTRRAFPQRWVETQCWLGEALQSQVARNGFLAGLEEADRLGPSDVLRRDPSGAASLHALAVVCRVGLGQLDEARRELSGLIARVEAQPDDFSLAWDWTILRDFLSKSEDAIVKAHRKPLLGLIDAVSGKNKRTILDGLKAVAPAV